MIFFLTLFAIATAVNWEPCPFFRTEPHEPPAGVTATCAVFEVPLFWGEGGESGEGGSIVVWAKRYTPAAGVEAQVFLNSGGPGHSAAGLEHAAIQLHAANPNLEFVLMDARGVNMSTALPECPGSPLKMNVTACWERAAAFLGGVERLPAISTTETAHDLAHVVCAAKREGTPVHLYGVSYGTYMLSRYLVLLDDRALPTCAKPSTVVLDSWATPTDLFRSYDVGVGATATHLMAACAKDRTCLAHLGPVPIDIALGMLAVWEAGQLECGAFLAEVGLTPQLVRQAGWLLGQRQDARVLLPPLYLRLLRCSATDRPALAQFAAVMDRLMHSASHSVNVAVELNVALSEMWQANGAMPVGPNAPVQFANSSAAYLWASYLPSWLARSWADWPVYVDGRQGRWFANDVPLLVLSGMLDPETNPYMAAMGQKHLSPSQRILSVPYGAHGDLFAVENCTVPLVVDFWRSKSAEHLDSSCVDAMPPPDFSGALNESRALSITFFGTSSLWG